MSNEQKQYTNSEIYMAHEIDDFMDEHSDANEFDLIAINAPIEGMPGRICMQTVAVMQDGYNETDAMLLSRAWNSYRKNFADPVAAAEQDMVGEMVQVLRSICSNSVHVDIGDADCYAISCESYEAIRKILAKTK
jgi:hypothetical protein